MQYINGAMLYSLSDWLGQSIPFMNVDMFGTPLAGYVLAMLAIFFTIIFAKLLYYFIKTYVTKLTRHTKSDLDDIIVDMIEEPLIVFIVIIGLWLSIVFFINLPESVVSFISSVRDVLIVLNIIWLITRLFEKTFDFYIVPYTTKTKSKLDDQLVPIIKDGIRFLIIGLGILFLIQNAGYNITAILGGLGIAGIAVAMAAQTSLSDVLGGAVIFANQPFELYDFIKFSNYSGTVEKINLRFCKLKTLDGTELIVPNSVIANKVVENYSRSKKRRVDMKLGLVYDTSYKQMELAKTILKSIITKFEDTDDPLVYFEDFGDSALVIRFKYFVTDPRSRFAVIDKVNMEIKKEFEKNKIEFAYPTTVVHMRK